MIKVFSTKISLEFSNAGKQSVVDIFRSKYTEAVQFYVDQLWDGYQFEINSVVHEFNPNKRMFDLPKFVGVTEFKPDNNVLSARVLLCAVAQAIGIVSSRTEKLRRQQYVMRNKMREGADVRKLQRKYDKSLFRLKRPVLKSVNPELTNLVCSLKFDQSSGFDGAITLTSLFTDISKLGLPEKFKKAHGLKIVIPFRSHAHQRHLESIGTKLNNAMLLSDSVVLRYEVDVQERLEDEGRVLGADQGSVTTLTLSDGQVTGKCIHGHDLNSIQKKMIKKKKGSKAFRRAQQHRTNYINWSVKQLNLHGVSELRLERLRHMGKGKRQSRFLQAWTYKEIRTAVEKTCFMNGVRFLEQSNEYRSQRCSCCGFVLKSNRKGKTFKCKKCGFTHDADLNAALNHEINLSRLPFGLRELKMNRGSGFYWTSEGLFSVDGHEFIVRDSTNGMNLVYVDQSVQ